MAVPKRCVRAVLIASSFHRLMESRLLTLTFSSVKYQPKILKAELQPKKNLVAEPQLKKSVSRSIVAKKIRLRGLLCTATALCGLVAESTVEGHYSPLYRESVLCIVALSRC